MKRSMAKAVVLMLLVSTLLMMMTGCGKKYADSKYTGKWEAVSYEAMGIELSVDEIGESSLDLKANGKIDGEFMGEKGSGKWEETDDGIKIIDGKETLDLVYEDDTLIMEIDGVKMNFQKK